MKRQIEEFPKKILLANKKVYEADNLIDKEDYEGAIKLYNQYIELNPNYEDAYGNRGRCYEVLGDYVKAKADYAKADELYKS